jgi:hypothetical protein
MSWPVPGVSAAVKSKLADRLAKPSNSFRIWTSFIMPTWLTVKSFKGGETSPVTAFTAEVYSDWATDCETPSCAAIAWTEQASFAGVCRNWAAAYIEVMKRVKSAVSLELFNEDSRMVKALEVTGETTAEIRSRMLGCRPVGKASPSTVKG